MSVLDQPFRGGLCSDPVAAEHAPHRFQHPRILPRRPSCYTLCWLRSRAVRSHQERTLSIHTVDTVRREAFCLGTWFATFRSGTALGDLTATTLHLGYGLSMVLFAGIILIPAIGYRWLGRTRSSRSGSPMSSHAHWVLHSPISSGSRRLSAVSDGVRGGSLWACWQPSSAWSASSPSPTEMCNIRTRRRARRVRRRGGRGRRLSPMARISSSARSGAR